MSCPSATFNTVIRCVGLYKAGFFVESAFNHLTVEPGFTVILAGKNPLLLIEIVLSDTEGVLVKVGVAVTDVIWVIRGDGVAVGFTGAGDCVQPLAITRNTRTTKSTRHFFINKSRPLPVNNLTYQ
jgi:hypothetical protein